MAMRIIGMIGCVLMLAGCGAGERIGSFADSVANLWRPEQPEPLELILVSAEETPGSQSLLFTAMVEAAAAEQSTGRAVVVLDQPAQLETALGEVVYALSPPAAPDWEAKDTGLVPGWSGRGYGLIRAGDEMLALLRRLPSEDGAAAEPAIQAAACVAGTVLRAQQALELAANALQLENAQKRAALLPQLERLTAALSPGLDADGDGVIALSPNECGLQQAERILAPLRFSLPS